jgi:hypothetical protein
MLLLLGSPTRTHPGRPHAEGARVAEGHVYALIRKARPG